MPHSASPDRETFGVMQNLAFWASDESPLSSDRVGGAVLLAYSVWSAFQGVPEDAAVANQLTEVITNLFSGFNVVLVALGGGLGLLGLINARNSSRPF